MQSALRYIQWLLLSAWRYTERRALHKDASQSALRYTSLEVSALRYTENVGQSALRKTMVVRQRLALDKSAMRYM